MSLEPLFKRKKRRGWEVRTIFWILFYCALLVGTAYFAYTAIILDNVWLSVLAIFLTLALVIIGLLVVIGVVEEKKDQELR